MLRKYFTLQQTIGDLLKELKVYDIKTNHVKMTSNSAFQGVMTYRIKQNKLWGMERLKAMINHTVQF